jgi:methionyl-tRNA formyltransferase
MAEENYSATRQNDDISTYAHKLEKAEAEINWQLTANEIDRKIRAYNPWPIAQFTFTEGTQDKKQHRIRVWQASINETQSSEPAGTILSVDKAGIVVATAKGAICLEVLQLPNKKALPVQDILNGRSEWFTLGTNINGAFIKSDAS